VESIIQAFIFFQQAGGHQNENGRWKLLINFHSHVSKNLLKWLRKPDIWSRVRTRAWCLVSGRYIELKISADCSLLQRVVFDTPSTIYGRKSLHRSQVIPCNTMREWIESVGDLNDNQDLW